MTECGITVGRGPANSGNYRIVYEIHDDELLVLVINVAPRGEVYR